MRRERQRYGVLLLLILAAFLLEGVGATGDVGQVIITALLGGAVVFALVTADARPLVLRIATMVAVAVTVLSAVNPDGAATEIANLLMVSIGPPAIALGLMRGLRHRGVVTIEAVLGVLCIYLLLGMFFAFVYGAVDRLGGAPFFAGGQPTTQADLLYFSFTSLTTVGYGDFTARSNLGHTLANLEALIGQLYLVTIVGVIVGNLRPRPPASPDRDDASPPGAT